MSQELHALVDVCRNEGRRPEQVLLGPDLMSPRPAYVFAASWRAERVWDWWVDDEGRHHPRTCPTEPITGPVPLTPEQVGSLLGEGRATLRHLTGSDGGSVRFVPARELRLGDVYVELAEPPAPRKERRSRATGAHHKRETEDRNRRRLIGLLALVLAEEREIHRSLIPTSSGQRPPSLRRGEAVRAAAVASLIRALNDENQVKLRFFAESTMATHLRDSLTELQEEFPALFKGK